MSAGSAKKSAAELQALASAPDRGDHTAARDVLVRALGIPQGALIAQAARLAAEHHVTGLESALRKAFHSLTGERAASLDPGASGKQAVIIALDALADTDAETFAEAARLVQHERVKGAARDVAGSLRSHALLGLARLGHADFSLLAGACLGDPQPAVRLSAARALGHRGDRGDAGLLLMRLAVGDDTDDIVRACVHGLFALAPDYAARHARSVLTGGDERTRTAMLHALGTAPHDDAVTLLAEELARHVLSTERVPVIDALGLSLRPAARTQLLELVSGDSAGDAEAALGALAIHRYDPRLAAELRARTAHSRALTQRFASLF